eukprot:1579345-Prymnesium_polylepis.3
MIRGRRDLVRVVDGSGGYARDRERIAAFGRVRTIAIRAPRPVPLVGLCREDVLGVRVDAFIILFCLSTL